MYKKPRFDPYLLWTRLEQAALAAAQGTGTEVDWKIIHGNHPLLVNETLAQLCL